MPSIVSVSYRDGLGMDEALPRVKSAMWKDSGGRAFGEVLDNGCITVGDPVEWIDWLAPRVDFGLRINLPCYMK